MFLKLGRAANSCITELAGIIVAFITPKFRQLKMTRITKKKKKGQNPLSCAIVIVTASSTGRGQKR